MEHKKWRRWQGWRGRVTYWKGWAAYVIFMSLPRLDILPLWTYGWLLPSVGDYSEWDTAIELMREELAQ